MEKRWIYGNKPKEAAVKQLASAINISQKLATVLVQRGVATFEQAKAFFRPNLEELHNPFLMKDMDKAVTRLLLAMKRQEKILIYGDYDVDGTTSVALVYGFLRKYYPRLNFYIPDRYKEGYGVSNLGIDYAYKNKFTLIISLDCGIKAHTQIKKAQDSGIDFIVCDHHNPGTLPEAYAVLDPKRKDCAYPYKELSGCGVGFKLMQAFCQKQSIDEKELFRHLDLLAVSIASDIVPMTGENRILTYWGLKVLNKNPRPGFKALIDVSGFKKSLDIEAIVFGIGPRINAAGRIAHAKAAVELLLAEDLQEAILFAKQINENNISRKDHDTSITQEALAMIENEATFPEAKSTVLFKENWHKGVIGIVASRCIEKYYRPTVILTESNNLATGSARSVAGFDLYEAISKCSDLLEQFGGHTFAAGLSLKKENINAFRKRFDAIAADALSEEQLTPFIEIDCVLELKDISQKFYAILAQMAPFGPRNLQPVFVSENVFDTGKGKLLKGKHLKLCLKQEGSKEIEAIGFDMPSYYERIASGERFRLCYTLSENTWNGISHLQIFIKDIKFNDN